MVPTENTSNTYSKFWKTVKEYYDIFESGYDVFLPGFTISIEPRYQDVCFPSHSLRFKAMGEIQETNPPPSFYPGKLNFTQLLVKQNKSKYK